MVRAATERPEALNCRISGVSLGVRDNIQFQERTIERLRRREQFTGARYELLVAATFVRAGFRVEPEDFDTYDSEDDGVMFHTSADVFRAGP